jgi:predicted DNA binding CopG/RHH family protein
MVMNGRNTPEIGDGPDSETPEVRDMLREAESGVFEAVAEPELSDLQRELVNAARRQSTAERTPISIRVPTEDLQTIKTKAAAGGVRYQTLINTILHKFAKGELVEK